MLNQRTNQNCIHAVTDDELKILIDKYPSKRQILQHLNATSGSSANLLNKRIEKLGLQSKFESSQFWNKGKTLISDKRIFAKNERALSDNSSLGTGTVRDILIKDYNVPYECNTCKCSTWQGQKIILELDHINGDNRDNRIENLRLLCPNCHSLTPTWRGRNKGGNSGKLKVTDDELLDALTTEKTIRKALIKVGLSGGKNYYRCYELLSKKHLDVD